MSNHVLNNVVKRTNGEVYIGVVGPVRTGKSTFIKKFIENLVVPKNLLPEKKSFFKNPKYQITILVISCLFSI